jgi:hypothetical protein
LNDYIVLSYYDLNRRTPSIQVYTTLILIIYDSGIIIGFSFNITKSAFLPFYIEPTISSIWHCQAESIVIPLIA